MIDTDATVVVTPDGLLLLFAVGLTVETGDSVEPRVRGANPRRTALNLRVVDEAKVVEAIEAEVGD